MAILSIGKRIQKIRKEKGLTAEKLAEASGITTNYMREIENDRRTPSVSTLVDVANALEITANELLCDLINKNEEIILNDITRKMKGLNHKHLSLISSVVETMITELE